MVQIGLKLDDLNLARLYLLVLELQAEAALGFYGAPNRAINEEWNGSSGPSWNFKYKEDFWKLGSAESWWLAFGGEQAAITEAWNG